MPVPPKAPWDAFSASASASAVPAASAPDPASSAVTMSISSPASAVSRGKRVPDHQRRRAAVSCDHCKQRRAKCKRETPRDPCSNCIGSGIPCRSTLPRKQRVYGSVESLSLRYRALEALVRGLLAPGDKGPRPSKGGGSTIGRAGSSSLALSDSPDAAGAGPGSTVLDLDALYRAAAERGIPMPSRDDMTPAPASALFASANVPSSTSPPPDPDRGQDLDDDQKHDLDDDQKPAHSAKAAAVTVTVAEKLVPTPLGVGHYIGPSSSFCFVTSIRELLSATAATKSANPITAPSTALEPEDSHRDDGQDQDQDRDHMDDCDAMDGVIMGSGDVENSGGQGKQQQQERLSHTRTLVESPSASPMATPTPAPIPMAMPTPAAADGRRWRLEPDDAAVATTFLPPRETANIFVSVFFERVHPNYPLFDRSEFQQRYETMWLAGSGLPLGPGLGLAGSGLPLGPGLGLALASGASSGPASGPAAAAAAAVPPPPDLVGWNCCLAMVLAFGAQALEGHDRARRAAAMQRRYLQVVRGALGRLAGTTNLANVQALMLLQLYEHNAGQRNAAWTFLGCAARMAVALGMHRDGVVPAVVAVPGPEPGPRSAPLPVNPSASPTARRRVWWTLYAFERHLCIMLGRPSALDEAEMAVALPDDYDLSDDLPQGYLASLLRLVRATWRIKQVVYAAPTLPEPGDIPAASPSHSSPAGPHSAVRRLLADLDAWLAALPSHLQPCWQSMIPLHRRAVLLLHVGLQYARSLATRSYVLERATAELRQGQRVLEDEDGAAGTSRAANVPPPHVDALADICVEASERGLDYLIQLDHGGLFDGIAWTDVYFVYHFVVILCLDLLGRSATTGHGRSEENTRLAARRKSVRDALRQLQNTFLAPTYRVLIGVARQLAAIVGALDGPVALPAPAPVSRPDRHISSEKDAQDQKRPHPSQKDAQDQKRSHPFEKDDQDQKRSHPFEKDAKEQKRSHPSEKDAQGQKRSHPLPRPPSPPSANSPARAPSSVTPSSASLPPQQSSLSSSSSASLSSSTSSSFSRSSSSSSSSSSPSPLSSSSALPVVVPPAISSASPAASSSSPPPPLPPPSQAHSLQPPPPVTPLFFAAVTAATAAAAAANTTASSTSESATPATAATHANPASTSTAAVAPSSSPTQLQHLNAFGAGADWYTPDFCAIPWSFYDLNTPAAGSPGAGGFSFAPPPSYQCPLPCLPSAAATASAVASFFSSSSAATGDANCYPVHANNGPPSTAGVATFGCPPFFRPVQQQQQLQQQQHPSQHGTTATTSASTGTSTPTTTTTTAPFSYPFAMAPGALPYAGEQQCMPQHADGVFSGQHGSKPSHQNSSSSGTSNNSPIAAVYGDGTDGMAQPPRYQHYQQQPQQTYRAHAPQADSAGWALQAWRELNTRYP